MTAAAFDHLVISCATLAEGAETIEETLGVSLVEGGRHAAFGTHNRLLSLGPDEYLEVIAIDPAAPVPARPRWFGLDRFSGPPRPTHWAIRVEDLEKAGAPGDLLELERGAYRWRMAVPPDGVLPHDELHPAMLEWRGAHPAASLPEAGCRLEALLLYHPEPARLGAVPGAGDPRVAVLEGPPSLSALIGTPNGPVWL